MPALVDIVIIPNMLVLNYACVMFDRTNIKTKYWVVGTAFAKVNFEDVFFSFILQNKVIKTDVKRITLNTLLLLLLIN